MNITETDMKNLVKKSRSLWAIHIMHDGKRPNIAEYWYQRWLNVQNAINIAYGAVPTDEDGLMRTIHEARTGI